MMEQKSNLANSPRTLSSLPDCSSCNVALLQNIRALQNTGVLQNIVNLMKEILVQSYRKVDKTGIGVSPKLWGSNYLDDDR